MPPIASSNGKSQETIQQRRLFEHCHVKMIHGNCLDVMPTLPSQSFDCIITDPPYPYIKRPYGTWTEEEWWDLMMGVCKEVRRILKPSGSAVFILQPNSKKIGSMHKWVWRFLLWVCDKWNMVQDAYWWNHTILPTVHANRRFGLMRPSVKFAVWAGSPSCYRNQDAVLWSQSEANKAIERCDRALQYLPSGSHIRKGRCASVADERGGVTPFNLIPISNTNSKTSSGVYGHGAGTPLKLCQWWIRYICPPNGIVLDPFCGNGSTLIAALEENRNAVGIEIMEDYVHSSHKRLDDYYAKST